MSSLFRARRSDEPRSGGKMLRGRRATPSASPYARPESSPPPPASQLGSPRWLSGLISGAGKLISSVLPSRRSSDSPSSPSDDSSDEDHSEDMEELQPLNQEGNESELEKCMDRPLAIVPKSETKLAIEQLLMQESFSRDECDKLTKLIQSRVVDFPSPEVCGDGREELQSRTTGNGTLSGALLSFRQKRNLPEKVPYFSSKTNASYPGSSLFEACTPDICNKAVSEAKKWLEEKKLASKQKYDSECGPCTLNTDMLRYDTESEVGSPVDMAKSYMRSLPPWRSPSLSGVGFRTPPPSGMHHYKDETLYETSDNSLHSSKGLKRDRLFFGSWDTLDETPRVRLRSTDDKLETAKSKQMESSARVSEHGSSRSLLETDKRELHCGDPCADGAFILPDEKDADANHPFETCNLQSLNTVSEQEEIIGAVHSTHEISVPNTHLLEPTQTLDDNQALQTMKEVDNVSVPHDTLASASRLDHDGNPSSEIKVMPMSFDDNQEAKNISQTMEEVDNVSVPHDTLASASRLEAYDGNPSSEIKVMPMENSKSAVASDADDVADLNDVQTSNKQTSTGVEGTIISDSSSELNPVSAIALTNCSSDSRSQDENSHIPKKANGSTNALSANGSSAEVNTNFNHETLSKGTDATTPQNGTRMKSIERMLTEPKVTTSRRGRKVVVKSRRRRKS